MYERTIMLTLKVPDGFRPYLEALPDSVTLEGPIAQGITGALEYLVKEKGRPAGDDSGSGGKDVSGDAQSSRE